MVCTAVIMSLLDQIESSNTIDGEHCAIWVPVCHHLHHMCDALAPTRVDSCWKGLVASSNLVMNCFARVFATNLLMMSPTTIPDPPICLLHAGLSSGPHSKRRQFLREVSPVVQPQHCREVGSLRMPEGLLKLWKNSSLSNSRGFEGFTALTSSGMGSLGHGGRLSLSLSAFKISSVPGATGDPSSEIVQLVWLCHVECVSFSNAIGWRLQTSGPALTTCSWGRCRLLKVLSTTNAGEVKTSRDPCLHAADNLLQDSQAERYAPLKNAGSAFITQTIRKKISWTLTMWTTVPTLLGTSEIHSDNTDLVSATSVSSCCSPPAKQQIFLDVALQSPPENSGIFSSTPPPYCILPHLCAPTFSRV